MIPIETLFTFVTASALLALAPGPDNIFVLTQAALNGRWSGVLITLGLCTGLIVHTALVAFGVAAIFQQSLLAFTVLKIVGAGYLVYLAWMWFRAKVSDISLSESQRISAFQLYRRGIIMNVTNPKVSIFFLAFLPQFASLKAGPLLPQIIVLGFLFIVVAFLVFSTVAFLAGSLGKFLKKSPKTQIFINRLAGVVFIGLAVKLVLAER